MAEVTQSIQELIGKEVVLDTAGPVTYLGTLKTICPEGFWLENADFRDRVEGHATKERYICEAKERGIRPNRQRLFVFSHVVISISSLDEVIGA